VSLGPGEAALSQPPNTHRRTNKQSIYTLYILYITLYADEMLLLTGVVHTGLDDVIQGEATGGGLSPQPVVNVLGQHLPSQTQMEPCQPDPVAIHVRFCETMGLGNSAIGDSVWLQYHGETH